MLPPKKKNMKKSVSDRNCTNQHKLLTFVATTEHLFNPAAFMITFQLQGGYILT